MRNLKKLLVISLLGILFVSLVGGIVIGFLNRPSEYFRQRRISVLALIDHLKEGEFAKAAYQNALLSQEAFIRSEKVLKCWSAREGRTC